MLTPYDTVQILQVVRVLHFPLDDILIFATSLCIVLPFVFEVLALHYSSLDDKRFWTHAALIFTTIYAVFGSANYVVQLTTVIPAKLRGAGDTVRLLDQTPHSLFWDFDAVAYIMMGLASRGPSRRLCSCYLSGSRCERETLGVRPNDGGGRQPSEGATAHDHPNL